MAQRHLEKKNHDQIRGLVVGSYGGLEIGFEAKVWLPLLDRVFGHQMTKVNAVRKLLFEQLLYTPIETACFMKWIYAVERRPESFHDKMSRDYLLTLTSNLGYWIPVSFINFYIVPIQYRALYVALTTLIIDTFTSFASHNNLKKSYETIIKSLNNR